MRCYKATKPTSFCTGLETATWLVAFLPLLGTFELKKGYWLPDGGGSEAVPSLQQVVGVPHVLCLLWHQRYLTKEVYAFD